MKEIEVYINNIRRDDIETLQYQISHKGCFLIWLENGKEKRAYGDPYTHLVGTKCGIFFGENNYILYSMNDEERKTFIPVLSKQQRDINEKKEALQIQIDAAMQTVNKLKEIYKSL